EQRGQFTDAACPFANGDSVFVANRDARTVVAAIFKAMQSLHQEPQSIPWGNRLFRGREGRSVAAPELVSGCDAREGDAGIEAAPCVEVGVSVADSYANQLWRVRTSPV